MSKLARFYLFIVALLAVVSLSTLTLAQETTGQESPTAKDLSFLIGKWETDIVVMPTEMTPQKVTGRGTAEFELFGQAVWARYKSEMATGHHEMRELIVYQKESDTYQIFTINLSGNFTQRTMSRYIDVWTIEYNGQMKDKEFVVRARYKVISDNELLYESEINMDGEGFKPFVELKLRRISK